jgi:D-arabinitol dehydrogenase (NADP+)
VLGAGATGLLLAQLLASGGVAHVTVASPTQHQLDRAEALGIDATVQIDRHDPEGSARKLLEHSEGGYDNVVEATGSARVGAQCVGLTRDGGTVMIYGVTHPDDTFPIHPYDIFRREITIKGSFARSPPSRRRSPPCGPGACGRTGSSHTATASTSTGAPSTTSATTRACTRR